MRVLIVGGGIAGPATAMALHRVGIEAIVLEAEDDARGQTGSYLNVAPNGLAALDEIGALEVARREGFHTNRNIFVSSTGATLGTVNLGRPLRPGLTAVTVKRPRLAEQLSHEAQRRGVDVRFGSRVTSAETGSDAAWVTFADGTTLDGDVVLGADGVHSATRVAIDPAAPQGRYVGFLNFGGFTPKGAVAAALPPEACTMVFGRHAFYGAQPTPAGDVFWFVNLPHRELTREERRATSAEVWQSRLAEQADADAGPFGELIRTGRFDLVGDNTYDLEHVPTWHRDRLGILGDAAHAPSPSSGQGASMALEDAIVIARLLRDAPSPHLALAAFETERRARVERIVKNGARYSNDKTAGPVARRFRDGFMRIALNYLVTENSQAWIFDHRVGLASPEIPTPRS